jgi:hypothetical protein
MSARNVAMTEISGQLGVINNNLASETDAIVQQLVDQGKDNAITIATANLTSADDTKATYSQQVQMTMNCRACPAPTGGFSYGIGVQALTATIDSQAALNASAANSTQEQGFWYLVPAGN